MAEKNQIVFCGTCGEKFESNEKYLKHVCKVTGFKADSIEHLDACSGGKFSLISKAALERGKKRAKK